MSMRRIRSALTALVVGTCLLCGLAAVPAGRVAYAAPQGRQTGTVQAANSAKPSRAQRKRFVATSADFSLELFRRCVKAKGRNANVTVAPMSVMETLALCANGANGSTATQMRKVLGGGASLSRINANLAWYHSALPSSKKARVRSANAVWYNDATALQMRKKFLTTASRTYGAKVAGADFSDPTTVDAINGWVSDKTNGMIKQLVNDLSPDDRVIVANALYLDARWKVPFEKGSVRKQTFTTASGAKRRVQMMHGTEGRYIQSAGVTGFIKPYVRGYSYVALLPNKGTSLRKFVAGLDGTKFRKLVSGATRQNVDVGLPKYTVSYSNGSMERQLAAMGMRAAFQPSADFSKMATDPAGLYLGSVAHKTKVEVDEDGTRAAAVTAAFERCGASFVKVKQVVLNRPFVYAIVDNTTKLPVFIGTVADIGA